MSDRVLGDLADLTVGHVGPMASEYVEDGVPFLRSLNVRPFRIDLEGVKYIPQAFHRKLAKSTLKPGDVVVVRTGAPGTAAVVPETLPVSNCSDVVIVRPGPDLDSRYLAYLINSVARGYIDSRTVGAVQQHFNVSAAKGIPIPAATLDEQRRIATVLGAFDDLIDSNRLDVERMVKLAQAVLSGGDASSVIVSEAATLSRGLSYKGSGLVPQGTAGSRPMVNLANFTVHGWAHTSGLKYYSEAFKEQHILGEDDLLIANTDLTQRREILGRAVLVRPALVGAIHSHHTSVVRFARDPWLRLFLWAQSQLPAFRERAMGFATGTTVAALPKEAVLDFSVSLPSNPEQVAASARALILEAWEREEENADLIRTRDELLPLLMSGKVRVSKDLAVA